MAQISNVISYNNPANFTFNTSIIEIPTTKAQLKLVDLPNQDFEETFDSDTGFTYDSAKTEFTGGVVQQIDQTPTNMIMGVNYGTNQNANIGTAPLTGTLKGGATVTGGKLDSTTSVNDGCEYPGTIGYFTTQGTLRFKHTHQNPVASGYLFDMVYGASGGETYLRHTGSGALNFVIKNDDGSLAFSVSSVVLSWNNGQEYIIEIFIDTVAKVYQVRRDGVLIINHSGVTVTRAAAVTKYCVGNYQSFAGGILGLYDDFAVYDAVLSSDLSYTIPNAPYVETTVTTPEIEHTGAGTIQVATDFVTSVTGSPKFTIQIGQSGDYLYWDGGAWSVSDESYAQATDAATFLTNIASLPVSGEVYVQFQVHFPDSNTQSSVDNLVITMTLQEYTIGGSPIEDLGVTAKTLVSFAETTATRPTNTDIKYYLNVSGTKKYWNGSAWTNSNGSYAQSSTAAEINTNASTLDISAGVLLKVGAILYTSDGLETPTLTTVTLGYSFVALDPGEASECVVYCFIEDLFQETGNIDNAKMIIYHDDAFEHTDKLFVPSRQEIDFDTAGYAEASVIETTTIGFDMSYEINYQVDGVDYRVQFDDAPVPNSASSNLLDITDPITA